MILVAEIMLMIGFLSLLAGTWLLFGLGSMLVVAGSVMMWSAGRVLVRRRNR